MVKRIGTAYSRVLDKGFSSRFCGGSQVRHEKLENRRTYRPKHCEYNSENEVNSPNILSDINY